MKYKDMLATKEGYHPVYDLENESPNLWKRFIPNDNFYTVLTTVLNSIEPSSGVEKKRSIWIHGTYGTGKSHATSVIKHLMWDDIDDIADFIEDFDNQYRYRIEAFRKKNKVLPVIIKGASNITDNRSFSAAVQKAVTDSLKSYGIWDEISAKNDFENMYSHITSTQEYKDWNKFIDSHKDLKIYVKDKKNLLRKLKEGNFTVLKTLEKLLNESGVQVLAPNIADWLTDVGKELKEKKIADYLMIFWDEFTSILELERADMNSSGISSSEWQNIAELSKDKNVYLFIVSHRFPGHFDKQDEKKTLDRFNRVNYVMQPLTTYHIMEAAIKKIDIKTWKDLKEKYVVSNADLVDLIRGLVGNEGSKSVTTVMNLFPLHPYTSYLTTFISRYLGSAQRSVFSFLTNKEMGFLKFIEENPNENYNIFLTPDLLWDFFLDEFERLEANMAAPILDKFKNNREKVEEAGKEYFTIFKSILLLNILKYQVKVEEASPGYVHPSEDNIKSMFIGTEYIDSVGDVLEFLNENGIVQKSPYGVFEIVASTLDTKKVDDEIDKLTASFDLLKALKPPLQTKLKDIFAYDALRYTEAALYNTDQPEYQLSSKLHRDLGECKYEISVAVFIAKDQADITNAESVLKKLSAEEHFNNVIFVLSQEPLKKVDFDRYLQYKARANVANTLNDYEQWQINDDNANKILTTWIDNIKQQYALYFFRGKSKKIIARDFKGIRNKLSQKIYSSGLENTPARQHATIWKIQKSKTAVEIILNANARNDLNKTTAQFTKLQEMFKDSNSEWIIDNELRIKTDADNTHPIIRAKTVVEDAVKNETQHNFHLGEVLSPLSKPPFGYYSNPVNSGALAYLLKPYVGYLYDIGTGFPVDRILMREKILAIFDYWKDGRERENILQVRFGTVEELKLIEKLKDIFKLDKDIKSLNDVRWNIRNKMKQWGYPLWVYKEFTDNAKVKKAIDSIDSLVKTIDKEINEDTIAQLLKDIEAVELDLPSTFSKQNDGKVGFIKWLKNIENIDDSDIDDESSFQDLYEYINNNLQEEITWEEDTVKIHVLQWKLNKERISHSERTQTGVDDLSASTGALSPKVTTEEIKHRQTKLDDYTKDWEATDWKKAISHAITEYPELWNILEKYLRG